ncbi:MAG: SGNH/GDSL hydrolase family protein [Burkholderiaceae bacterium]|nr:SGNH/GDSL hydrolase family protein [Burkholderiaceae bacterium]
MPRNWMRRAVLALACASATLLVACGEGTIESALVPSRYIAFGDGFSDVGQAGTRYTVNDGGVTIWWEQLAAGFGAGVKAASAGGTGYAQGNARILLKPDLLGSNTTPTVKEQVDAFLASNTIGANDLYILSGGISDIVYQMNAVTAGTLSGTEMVANAQQAGRDLGAQVRRLVDAGASYVSVPGVYNLGVTPFAASIGQGALLTEASSKFNEALLVSIVDLGAKVLYYDAAYYFNLLSAQPGTYSFDSSTVMACNSVDAGVGIGIGRGQVSSRLCTPSTIISGADYNRYLFADGLYLTPQAQRLFGDFAHTRLKARW